MLVGHNRLTIFAKNTHLSVTSCTFIAPSPLIERSFSSNLEDLGIGIAVYHERAHQFSGIEKHKLAACFQNLDVAIAFQVFFDR